MWQPGKSPKKEPEWGVQHLPDRLGQPCSLATQKPQGDGGSGGCSGKSHLSLKPGGTGWRTGMNQGGWVLPSLTEEEVARDYLDCVPTGLFHAGYPITEAQNKADPE